jgi:hypothetical protein
LGEQSDRMMTLLQELAVLKKGENELGEDGPAVRKRREQIGEEIKQLAADKQDAEV